MASEQQDAGIDAAKCRTEVLEYGNCPVCPWLTHLNSLVSLLSLSRDLLRRGQCDNEHNKCFVSLETLTDALGTTLQQTQVLLDLFASVLDDSTAVQTSADGTPIAADVHRLVLFLFVQYYTREASRADTADVWPVDHPSATQSEPSSPMRLATRPWAAGKEQQQHHRAHLPATRQKMQEHLLYEESVINGFSAFVSRHAAELVALAAVGGAVENAAAIAAFGTGAAASGSGAGTGVFSDNEDIFDASASEMEEQQIEESLTTVEIDRLGFLIQTAAGNSDTGTGTGGKYFENKESMMDHDESATVNAGVHATSASPMELCDAPAVAGIAHLGKPLSQCLPSSLTTSGGAGGGTSGGSSLGVVTVTSMVNWLRTSLEPTDLNASFNNNRNKNGGDELGGSSPGTTGSGSGSGGGGDIAMFGASPPQARFSMFDQLVPPSLSLLRPVDVYGVHRATVLRGESDFISSNTTTTATATSDTTSENNASSSTSNSFRVLDCHDAVVYCLASLEYATISCCTDCIVILGAAGKAVRVERCERVQVVVAAQHVVINTCHDCIFYLAVNRPPVLLGDNRFVQLAPHNAGYEKLEDHVSKAGVTAQPSAWCSAIPLLPDLHQHAVATKHHNAFLAGGGSYGSSPPLNSGNLFNNLNQQQQQPMAVGGFGVEANPPANTAATGAPFSTSPTPISLSLSPLKMPSPRSPSLASLSSPPSASALAVAGVSSSGSPSDPGFNTTSSLNHYQSVVSHPPAATLLPPAKLVPFLVPFTGGRGPLCGGPMHPRSTSSSSGATGTTTTTTTAADEDLLGGLLGGAGTLGAEAFGPTPFALPAEYAASWEERMSGMTAVRSAYRQAGLDDVRKREFITAVQAQFKEWLQAGSGMKEVYDLARAEKEVAQALHLNSSGGNGS